MGTRWERYFYLYSKWRHKSNRYRKNEMANFETENAR